MAGHSLGEQCVPLLCVVGLAPREVQLQMPVETSLSVGAEYENDQRHIRSTQRQRGTIWDRCARPIKNGHRCDANVPTAVRHIERRIRELCSIRKTYDVAENAIVQMLPNKQSTTEYLLLRKPVCKSDVCYYDRRMTSEIHCGAFRTHSFAQPESQKARAPEAPQSNFSSQRLGYLVLSSSGMPCHPLQPAHTGLRS